MKTKTYTTLALALAVSGCAWATEVVSSNVVGYQKISLNAGYNMIGAQFVDIGEDTLSIADTFIAGESFPGYSTSTQWKNSAYVMPWTGSSYGQKVYWSGEGAPIANRRNIWCANNFTKTAKELIPNEGFWIYSPVDTSILISGEVVTTNVTVELSAGYNMVCSPFPVELSIENLVVGEDFPGYSTSTQWKNAAYVMPWTGSSYGQKIYWSGEGAPIANRRNIWCANNFTKSSKAFSVGEGFWIYTPVATSVTFVYPTSSSEGE